MTAPCAPHSVSTTPWPHAKARNCRHSIASTDAARCTYASRGIKLHTIPSRAALNVGSFPFPASLSLQRPARYLVRFVFVLLGSGSKYILRGASVFYLVPHGRNAALRPRSRHLYLECRCFIHSGVDDRNRSFSGTRSLQSRKVRTRALPPTAM